MKPWMRWYWTPTGHLEIRGGVLGYQFGWLPALWAFVVWRNCDYRPVAGGRRWFAAWQAKAADFLPR